MSSPERKPTPLPEHLSRSDDVFGVSMPMPRGSEPEDVVEVWGKRIGRGLAVLAAIVIIALFLWPHLQAG